MKESSPADSPSGVIKAGVSEWLKSAIAGALGFIITGAATVAISAVTDGLVIRFMGGATR